MPNIKRVQLVVFIFIQVSFAQVFEHFLIADPMHQKKNMLGAGIPQNGHIGTPSLFVDKENKLQGVYCVTPITTNKFDQPNMFYRIVDVGGKNGSVYNYDKYAVMQNYVIDNTILANHYFPNNKEISSLFTATLLTPNRPDFNDGIYKSFPLQSGTAFAVTGGIQELQNYDGSNCDPNMVYYDGYYYLTYTGGLNGYNNVNYIARSKHINGPFEKYSSDGTWVVNSQKPAPISAFLSPISRKILDINNYSSKSIGLTNTSLYDCDQGLGRYFIPGGPYTDKCFDLNIAFANSIDEKEDWKKKFDEMIIQLDSLKKLMPNNQWFQNEVMLSWRFPIDPVNFKFSNWYGAGQTSSIVINSKIYTFFWSDNGSPYTNSFHQGFIEGGVPRFNLYYTTFDGSNFTAPKSTNFWTKNPNGVLKKDNENNICIYRQERVWTKNAVIYKECFTLNTILLNNSPKELVRGKEILNFTNVDLNKLMPLQDPTCEGVAVNEFDILSDESGQIYNNNETIVYTIHPKHEKDQIEEKIDGEKVVKLICWAESRRGVAIAVSDRSLYEKFQKPRVPKTSQNLLLMEQIN
jgi:hypothetical protein